MKGKYQIIIQNNRIKFEFEVRRNITIIRGDSATGKTTLMNMVETYDRLGSESGISISCEKECRTLNNSNWQTIIQNSHEAIIFIDEDTKVIKTKEFASEISTSDNYYVIITRENLPNLPYSVEEVYGIHNSGRYSDVRQTYNSFYKLYSVNDKTDSERTNCVVVEDSNSGFEFFKNVINDEIRCISAGGKSRIKQIVKNHDQGRVLIIADGAAFGSEMAELYLYMQSNPNVSMYLPESFEWVILSSGLIDGNRIAEIVARPEEYIDCSEYFSWEQFFTKLLVSETVGTYLQYGKSQLNQNYLNEKEVNAILAVMDVIRHRLR